MKNICIIIFILIYTLSFSQNDQDYVDNLLNEFITGLEEKGVDNYFSTKRYCNGEIEMFLLRDGTWCSSKSTYYAVYVFWIEGEDHMIIKLDNCGLYSSLKLKDSTIMDIYGEGFEDILANKVRTYDSETWTGVKLRTEVYPCFRDFTFKNENENSKQKFALFDLTNDSEGRNLNYDYNSQLAIVQLNKMLDTIISETASKFKRINKN